MPGTIAQNRALKHISIRVPWHDSGWNGTVCRAPHLNSSCTKLPSIGERRNDAAEKAVAGKSILELPQAKWPCCVRERFAFMAPFETVIEVEHAYKQRGMPTHQHFAPTSLPCPAYSAAALPFDWMLMENMGTYGERYRLSVDPEREPKLGFEPDWVQGIENQQELLDCFFDHIKPDMSLCFFYAKRIPIVDDHRRVLIGVGRVRRVGPSHEYAYHNPGEVRSMLWERSVEHSIRPDFSDGFLLPYQAAIEYADEHPEWDPTQIVAFAPDDRRMEFSHASQLVTHDAAIGSLLACVGALRKAKDSLSGPWDKCIQWAHDRLGELWTLRGPCPGLGAALIAFGIDLGHFLAYEAVSRAGENENPWPKVDAMLRKPAGLPPDLRNEVGKEIAGAWVKLSDERRKLLELVSRFELTDDHAKLLYRDETRAGAGILLKDADILENPYLIYETLRLQSEPMSFTTVDAGVFPDPVVRKKHPLPIPTPVTAGVDARRVRAASINVLETLAMAGHTLLPSGDLLKAVRDLPIDPPCELTQDTLPVVEETFGTEITKQVMADKGAAYQLGRLTDMAAKIRTTVEKRLGGQRHKIAADWQSLLDQTLGPLDDDPDEIQARIEKTAAIKELAEARFSVLIGPAGTGKTTLLSVLCGHPDIAAGDVLLLAPTGKARVKMEAAFRGAKKVEAYTIAQFLKEDRYDTGTGRYRLSEKKPRPTPKTVIVDEASMLTEEMLAALFDALTAVQRIVLIGDPRQLPPIGPGRPFVDIIGRVKPPHIDSVFPRVGASYAELTVRRRFRGVDREDLQLAEWFSGSAIAPGEDDVFDVVAAKGKTDHVSFIEWQSAEDLQKALLAVLADELKMKGPADVVAFDISLGGTVSGEYRYFNRGSAASAENWQILSPVRAMAAGVDTLNRFIHKTFRAQTIVASRKKPDWQRFLPPPMGPEEIVYGDKVINIRNHSRKDVWPEDQPGAGYLANGEIGMVIGQLKTKNFKKPPWALKVQFSSQPTVEYQFGKYDFGGEDGEPKLELAYALTVHKAQGSEFGLVVLVLPSPCRLLSREMLYTALTRQRDRVVILHQGPRSALKQYASDYKSETAQRITNLFRAPSIIQVEGRFLEEQLINQTRSGELVRSKSEVIIADRLYDLKVPFFYEQPLTLSGHTRYPDFTIEDADSGRAVYWEHCGMLQVPAYQRRWERKLAWYRANGILPADEGAGARGTLVVTRDNSAGGISSAEIDEVIRKIILQQP